MTPLLRAVVTVLSPTIRYNWRIQTSEREVLGFEARVDGKDLDGVDVITWGDDGLVHDLTVMIRPLSGLVAVRDAIAARLTA